MSINHTTSSATATAEESKQTIRRVDGHARKQNPHDAAAPLEIRFCIFCGHARNGTDFCPQCGRWQCPTCGD